MSIDALKFSSDEKVKRSFILPTRVLWEGNGVSHSERLLTTKVIQSHLAMQNVATLSGTEGKKGAILLDFGSEIAGGIEIIVGGVSNENGVSLRIRFGESASEAMTPVGEKNATSDHAVRDMEVCVTPLNQTSFGNTGYRFVYLEVEEDAWIHFGAIRGVFTYRDIPYLGSFSCDDSVLNEIYKVCAYTVHLNMQNMLWDGIKRDRLVWIGDMHPEMLAIRSVFGDCGIIDDCMKFITEINPLPQWPNHKTTYGFWYLLILWDWYLYNGRKELLLELKDYWLGLLMQLFPLIHEGEEELLDEADFRTGFFLDWPTKGTEEEKAAIYAFFRLTLLASAKLCEAVEAEEEKKKCLHFADVLAKPNMLHNNRKQVVAMLSMADMLDKQEAGEILTEDCGRGMSTFMSYYILSATAEATDVSHALCMLREYYGAMLDAGATTFWEDFDMDWVREGARIDKLLEPGEYDIHGDNGRFCYQGLRHSLCHGWSAGPAAFLAERVLGIRIMEPGCKTVAVKPELGTLSWAKGTYPTPYGMIRVEVRKDGDDLIMDIDAPEEIVVDLKRD